MAIKAIKDVLKKLEGQRAMYMFKVSEQKRKRVEESPATVAEKEMKKKVDTKMVQLSFTELRARAQRRQAQADVAAEGSLPVTGTAV